MCHPTRTEPRAASSRQPALHNSWLGGNQLELDGEALPFAMTRSPVAWKASFHQTNDDGVEKLSSGKEWLESW